MQVLPETTFVIELRDKVDPLQIIARDRELFITALERLHIPVVDITRYSPHVLTS